MPNVAERPAGTPRARLVAFGTFRTDLHPRVAVLIEGLRANSLDVEVINHPLPLDTAQRVGMLFRPWRVVGLMAAVAGAWGRLLARGRRAAADRPDAVLVGYLGHFDIHLARWVFGRRTPLVLDHMIFAEDTARDRGLTNAALLRMLRSVDRAALRRADVVLCDTDEHAASARAAGAREVLVVPVGAGPAWWGVPSAPPDGPLRAIFFGLFTPLHGTATIARALRSLPADLHVEVTLIGSGQDHAEVVATLDADPRVRFVDWLDEAELVAEVGRHHVVLGIFGTGEKAARVVPTKVYQGLAAGRVVVTGDTPPQRAATAGTAVLVPPGDDEALAAAFMDLAGRVPELAAAGDLARRTAAARFGPASVTSPLATALVGHTRRVLPPLTPHATLRWTVVEAVLAGLRFRSVLEIGCGRGAAGARLASRPGVSYVGIEPDEESYRAAVTAIGTGGTVVHGTDAAADDLPGPWDLVCAFEVLEHLEDDVDALQRWWKHTAPGGHLLLSVPAWQSRFGPMDEFVGHFRRYDPEVLRRRLAEGGWESVEVVEYGQVVGPVLEALRNRLAARRLGRPEAPVTREERTGGSGRLLQPRRAVIGSAVRMAMSPFSALRPVLPGPGTGLVALARRSSTDDAGSPRAVAD